MKQLYCGIFKQSKGKHITVILDKQTKGRKSKHCSHSSHRTIFPRTAVYLLHTIRWNQLQISNVLPENFRKIAFIMLTKLFCFLNVWVAAVLPCFSPKFRFPICILFTRVYTRHYKEHWMLSADTPTLCLTRGPFTASLSFTKYAMKEAKVDCLLCHCGIDINNRQIGPVATALWFPLN